MIISQKQTKNWLLGIATILIILHLYLSQQFGSNFLSHSFLFWIVAIVIIWQKQENISWQSDRNSSSMGWGIITFVLYRSLHLFPQDYFLQLYPILSLLGWSLIASGSKELKQYRKAFLLLGFLGIPWEFIYIFNVAELTARFSSLLLYLLGFEVYRQGIWLTLPGGSVEVYNGCSGVGTIVQLLGLSWIILTLIPHNWQQKIILLAIAIITGFIVNGMRVTLMAILVGLSDLENFQYWHVGTGSLIFSAIAVISLGIIARRNYIY